jgi:hypothetical protein
MTDLPEARCRTCLFWNKGGAPIATTTRIPDPNPDLGVCESLPPTVHIVGGGAHSMFPATHGDRACWDWVPNNSAPSGPDGGRRKLVDNVVPLRGAA